jgi:hypothetical protein
VALRAGLFQAGQVGVDHLLVPVEGEDQGDVDADAFGQDLSDRGNAGLGRWDLDEEIRPVRVPVELGGRVERARGVVGEPRRNLERDPAVDTVRPLPDREELVGRATQVVDRELEERLLAGGAAAGAAEDALVVGAAARERVGEDRRVRRQAGDAELADVTVERPVVEQVAGDVVEPEALARLVQVLRRVHRYSCQLFWAIGSWLFAASTTRSGVKPNFVCSSFNGAEAPNVCMPITAPVAPA